MARKTSHVQIAKNVQQSRASLPPPKKPLAPRAAIKAVATRRK